MFMVDIAVPRDIEPGVGDLPDVYLYTIDDLTQLVEVNKARRLQAASGAENLVEQGTQQYQRERRVQRGQGLLQAFRNQAEQVRDSEMARTLRALENGADPAEALQKLGNALTNKLIHPTTAAIRNAAAEDRLDQLDFIQNTYDLQVPTAEHDQAHQARPANSHDEES